MLLVTYYTMRLALMILLVTTATQGHAAPALSKVLSEDSTVVESTTAENNITGHFVGATAFLVFSWVSFLIPQTKTEARLLVLIYCAQIEGIFELLFQMTTLYADTAYVIWVR